MTADADEKRRKWIGDLGEPVRVSHIANAALDMAMSIRVRQKALISAGWRSEPDAQEMRRAEVLEAGSKLLDKIAPRLKRVLEIIK